MGDGPSRAFLEIFAGSARLTAACLDQGKKKQLPVQDIPGGPPPLRSDTYPDGMPGLFGVNASRVLSANSLYAFSARVIQAAEKAGLPWVLENPTNSLFWSTFFWASVGNLDHVVADLQACAFGLVETLLELFIRNPVEASTKFSRDAKLRPLADRVGCA